MNGGHFKLGLFIVAATSLLVLTLLLLGVLERFKPSITIETYSEESVQSLVVGAPVRYLGVQLGRVSRIGFVRMEYPEISEEDRRFMGRTILIEMEFETDFLKRVHLSDLRERLPGNVKEGLRARLASTGLGGPTFVELAYLDPERFPVKVISWTPHNPYIPAAPSTITALVDSLNKILSTLSDDKMLKDMTSLLDLGGDLDGIIQSLKSNDTLPEIVDSLEELAAAGQSLSAVLEGDRVSDLVDDASRVLRSAREMLEDDGPEGVRPLIRSLTSMADTLERTGTVLDGLVAEIDRSDLIEELESLGTELGPAGRELGDLASRLDRLVSANESGIGDLIQSLRRATAQLQGLLEEAEENPSRMIFGDPPPRHTPGESR